MVHDNLKAAVVSANRHTPVLNLNFQQLREHYDIQPLPTRVRKPKDKASVESAVSVVQRWILFRLRKQKILQLG
ncbi:hypothetical protein V6667_01125 [Neisseria leonii]|uniref:Transposase n=1 Tax=Neisseria leonii TaxID=2995413 RepID=A0A9X4IF05_9NEIS|nr:hypothetical protein [Neisseria sp. 51.81]MDD9328767.1 hypothetical protein [Neisseria sp. 51.81]